MKSFKSKRIISIFISLIMLLSVFTATPFTALAVDDPGTLDSSTLAFWADPENTITSEDLAAFNNGDKTTMVGAVEVHKRSGSSDNYYLFLPSNADCTNLKVWFNADSASVDGTALTSGSATDVFSDADNGGVKTAHTLNLDGTDYSVTVIKSGDVGAIYIDTQSGTIANINNSSDKSVSEDGTILVVNEDGKVDYDGVLEKMKGRGNATWSANGKKNPYNIKIAKKTALLGMKKSKKWCLLANSEDSTLIKNQLTYDFANYIGVNYQVVCKPVDLYVNQQYLGSYMLAEKVEIGSNRVEVTDSYESLENANATTNPETGEVNTDLDGTEVTPYTDGNGTVATGNALRTSLPNADYYAHRVGARRYSPSLTSPSDITGGYLYEIEISNRWVAEGAGFCAYNRQGWVLKNCDYASKEMVDYSYDLLYALGSSVYNGGTVPDTATTTTCSSLLGNITTGATSITNPAPAAQYQGKKWSDLLDAESAVKYYWTQEYFKNMDSSTSSTYLYKDSDSVDSKLYAGPMWDMDQSLWYNKSASRWGRDYGNAEGWYTRDTRFYRWRANDVLTTYSNDNQDPLTFYAALATNCPDFWQMAKGCWYTKVEPATKILLGNAADPTGKLKSVSEYAQNVAKTGTMNNLRHNLSNDTDYDASGIASGITTWLATRTDWINAQFPKSDISSDSDFIIQSISPQSYTGSPIEPEITVTYNGAVLEKDVDYTVSYSENTNPTNNAVVSVEGKGLYTGTKTAEFVISLSTLSGGAAVIEDSAFPGDVLSATVTNSQGNTVNGSIVYQWYSDGAPISGETGRTYTVRAEDKDKNITVKVKGDGMYINTYEIESNPCAVTSLVVTDTLASWDYDYTADSTKLSNSDTTGETFIYTATGGNQAGTATLKGSVDSVNSAEIKWSDADLYTNSSNTVESDQSPVIEADKVTPVPWGEYPYFEISLSTIGYNNLKFSAKLGGTKKGPRDYKLQYSTDGTNYTDITGTEYSLTANKSMEQAFNNVSLPDDCSNKKQVNIRIVVYNDIAINATNTIVNQTSGSATVNNISLTGEVIEAEKFTLTFYNHAGTKVSEEEYISGTAAQEVTVPDNTASYYDDTNHYSYSWPAIAEVSENAEYRETENAEAHTFEKSVVTAPDCLSGGTDKYTCDCGCTYTEDTAPLGHTPSAPVKENETSASYDNVVYCSVCSSELSRVNVKKPAPENYVAASVPAGTVPSSAVANSAKENKSIVSINASKIATFADSKKKSLKLTFSTVKGATNYRVRYRKAGAKNWTYAWTGGKGEYTIKNLKNKGLYQFQIAVYVYRNRVWQRSKYSNVNYRYFSKLTGVKATAKKKSAQVKWKSDKNASGYDIAYATSKNGKKTVKSVKGANKKSHTVKKLKKGKTYYVFVRSYKNKGGKKYTGQWTSKKVKVK